VAVDAIGARVHGTIDEPSNIVVREVTDARDVEVAVPVDHFACFLRPETSGVVDGTLVHFFVHVHALDVGALGDFRDRLIRSEF
jgi:hypothetical protein